MVMAYGPSSWNARSWRWNCPPLSCVMWDESRLTKFPFSYLAHVTLLTPAQARLSPCSGFAQAGSLLLTLITVFSRLRRSTLNYFNSSRVSPELIPYIKNRQNTFHFRKLTVLTFLLHFHVTHLTLRDIKSASTLQVSLLDLLQALLLLFNSKFINIPRQNAKIQYKTGI